jgi:hypothetical protein
MNQIALIPIESPLAKETSIFLCLTEANTVSLEFVHHVMSPAIKENYDTSLGKFVRTSHLEKFYKPIGFYDKSQQLTLVKEFENEVSTLMSAGLIPLQNFNRMPLLDNALIGALSKECVLQAKQFKDSSIEANGLKIDLLMTHDNEYIQSYLDDSYGVQNALCAYQRVIGDDDDVKLNPTFEHKARYDSLYKKRLLTVYNAA